MDKQATNSNNRQRAIRALTGLSIFSIVSLILVVVMLALTYVAIVQNDLAETEFEVTHLAEPVETCSGQTFYVPIVYKIKRAPLVLRIFENWRIESVDSPYIIYGTEGQPHIFMAAGTFNNTLDIHVPPDLPAGDYTYIRAWEETAKWPSFIEVKVKVKVAQCN